MKNNPTIVNGWTVFFILLSVIFTCLGFAAAMNKAMEGKVCGDVCMAGDDFERLFMKAYQKEEIIPQAGDDNFILNTTKLYPNYYSVIFYNMSCHVEDENPNEFIIRCEKDPDEVLI